MLAQAKERPSDVTAPGSSTGPASAVSVVMITWNRVDNVLASLARLTTLGEAPPIVVVDNGSDDGTPPAVRARFADVEVLTMDENLGAAGRNVGVTHCRTPYVAFSDDDSWWAPGALTRAGAVLDAHPDVAVVAARVMVEPGSRPDPVCTAMAASPLGTALGDPGPQVLGFVACGAVVRRDAFLACGGFDRRFGVGGEEELLALDLAAAGRRVVYVADVVAHHQPATHGRDDDRRRRTQARNTLRVAWTRLPLTLAAHATVRTLTRGWRDRAVRAGAADMLGEWRDLRRRRRPVPRPVQDLWRACEQAQG